MKYFGFEMEELNEVTTLGFTEVFNDGDSVVFETEKVFSHTEERLDFEYRYAIETLDWFKITGDKKHKDMKLITIYLVPTRESLNVTIIESLKDIYRDDFYNIGTSELLAEGYSIRFLEELVAVDKESEAILFSKHLIPHLDSLRGFYLDKPFNMIGTTGWDMLHNYINNVSWLKH